MGKRSRKAPRKDRHRATSDRRQGMTVTIGVTPRAKPNGQPSLAGELRLLRSSLLYADHIDLVAPSASWLTDFRPLRGVTADNLWWTIPSLPLETLRRITPDDLDPVQARKAMRALRARPVNDPERRECERMWRASLPQVAKTVSGVFDSVEAQEIEMALDAGSVSMISKGTRFEDPIDQQVFWFRDRLTEALDDPGTHMLLDGPTTDFLRDSETYADGLPTVAATRSRHAAVGTGLVEQLPTFPDAPMDHVLEAREELAEGRDKYRASAKHLADHLESSALDATLPSDIKELWLDEVRPSLEDLRRSVSKTRVAYETGKRVITEGFGLPTVMAPVFSVAVANLSDLAASLPSAAAVAGAASRLLAAGASEAFAARAAVRQHDLVYLLDVDRKLGRLHR